MPDLTLTAINGGTTTVPSHAVAGLGAGLQGRLLTADSAGYDEARAVWNAMIDRRPGMIVECAGTPDVVRAVRFAADHGLLVAVRGGGHNIAGSAVCDGGLMISLAGMKGVRVDAAARRAWVEPGNTLGDVDRATQAHGLAVPAGINSTTGIAGLTLGGGFGWLSRKHAMTVDNLVSAQVVTAQGETVRASAKQHPDLFWGLRGGGGNFGIVTEFEFALHPVGPEVLAGLIVHPFQDARAVLRCYREFCATAPDELTVWAVVRKAPPLPFLPEAVHGTEVVVLAACYAGDRAAGEAALAPLRAFGTPLADVIGPTPFADFQTAFDPLLAPGARNYWKSHNLQELSDGLIETIIAAARALPDPQCEILLAQLGGAVNQIPADATAYAHRDIAFILNVHGRWSDASADARGLEWCRRLFDAAAPFGTGGAYVNFLTEDEAARVETVYGTNYRRLTAVKRQYDGDNLFRLNQNVRPGGQ